MVKEREWSITTSKSPDDPSIGLYKLRLDPNGYPHVFLGEGQVDNFRLAPWKIFCWCLVHMIWLHVNQYRYRLLVTFHITGGITLFQSKYSKNLSSDL